MAEIDGWLGRKGGWSGAKAPETTPFSFSAGRVLAEKRAEEKQAGEPSEGRIGSWLVLLFVFTFMLISCRISAQGGETDWISGSG